MPYGDYTDLTARQRVAALKALLNLALSSEDVHERIAQRAEAYRTQRPAKDALSSAPAAVPEGQPAAASASPAAPARGANRFMHVSSHKLRNMSRLCEHCKPCTSR